MDKNTRHSDVLFCQKNQKHHIIIIILIFERWHVMTRTTLYIWGQAVCGQQNVHLIYFN